jgi:hypothetical protein
MQERVIYLPKGEVHHVPPLDRNKVTKPQRKKLPGFEQSVSDIQTIQQIERGLDLWRHKIGVDVAVNGAPYFPILPLSDFHIGSFSTDYDRLMEYLDFARQYNVKILLLGDVADMFMPGKIPSGAQNDVSVEMQLHTVREFFREYQDLILCNISDPSHTGWLDQLTGIDFYRWITEDLDIPLLETGGTMVMHVNEQTYNLSLWHQIGQYNSSLNPLNAHRRIAQMHSADDPDLVISGHVHKGSSEVDKTIRGKKRLLVQCGTFKTEPGDKYGRKGFVGGVAQFHPLILLRSDKHDFEMIEDLDGARDQLDMIDLYNRQLAQGTLGYAN